MNPRNRLGREQRWIQVSAKSRVELRSRTQAQGNLYEFVLSSLCLMVMYLVFFLNPFSDLRKELDMCNTEFSLVPRWLLQTKCCSTRRQCRKSSCKVSAHCENLDIRGKLWIMVVLENLHIYKYVINPYCLYWCT